MGMVEPSAEYAQRILEYKRAFADVRSMAGVGALRKMDDPYERNPHAVSVPTKSSGVSAACGA